MVKLLKSLFGLSFNADSGKESPTRTFKRVLTGDYFGLRNPYATAEMIHEAKQYKVDQINALGLKPVFVRYAYAGSTEGEETQVAAAHVVFQKEEYDKKVDTVHVTEISFIVSKEEFSEFERLCKVSLQNDFNDLYEVENRYSGKERRARSRPSLLDTIDD